MKGLQFSMRRAQAFTGEHSSAAPSELGFLLFLRFAPLDKHLFDAKQPAAFPTYTHVSPFCISLSPLFRPPHLLLSHNDS